MSNNIFNLDFLEFLELLSKHKVEFLLVGGYAVVLHGYIRSTGDMDLWIERTDDNYNKLKKVYTDFSAPIFPEEQFSNPKFNVWGIGVEPSKIEILTQVDGLQFNESYKNRNYFNIDKLQIPYIDFEDLIKNKLASGRYKDLADIEQLKKLKKE
jgi:hypothetical protein